MKNLCIVFFLLMASAANATNYYVRKDGSDSCNGTVDAAGSSGDCAKLTIQAGVNLAYAGDTVYVGAGSYTGSPTFATARAGSSGSLITIRAAEGATVNIDRAEIDHAYTKVQGFTVVGARGFYEGGIYAVASNVWIYGCTIKGRGLYGYGSGMNTLGVRLEGANNTIESCIFEGSSTLATSFEVALYVISSSNTRITRNTFRYLDSPERAVEMYGTGILFDYNEVHSWLSSGISGSIHPDIFQSASDGINSSVTVEYNYFHDLQTYVQVANHYSSGTHNWTVRNNIFANIGMQWNVYAPGAWRFYNNLFYRVDTVNDPVLNFGGDYSGGAQVYNNAFIGCGAGDANNNGYHNGPSGWNFVSKINGAAKTSLSNVAATDINGGTIGMIAPYTNCVTNTCNFNLGSSSALIDKGTNLSSTGFSTDFAGNTRGTVWDIGPYEYGASVPPVFSSPTADGNASPASLSCDDSPTGYSTVTLAITSDIATTARMSTLDIDYYSMSDTFTTTGSTSHSEDKSLACGASYTYYVRGPGSVSSSTIQFSIAAQSGTARGNYHGIRVHGAKFN